MFAMSVIIIYTCCFDFQTFASKFSSFDGMELIEWESRWGVMVMDDGMADWHQATTPRMDDMHLLSIDDQARYTI